MTAIGPAHLPTHPRYDDAGAPGSGGDGGRLQAGTYNLAAGNQDHRGGVDDTTRTLAQQVVGNGVDVVALQEVDVGTADAAEDLPAGMDDYNEYVLAQVSAEEAGLQGEVSYTREQREDGSVVITGTDADGRTSQVAITREACTEDGQPVAADDPGAVVTVYDADVRTPDGISDYTVVYGSSIAHDGGTYGNAVLLGPGASLQRDANGNPMVTRHDLGANDPNGENRTALQVEVDVAGESATVFSAHLSAGSNGDQAAVDARKAQYATLASLARDSGDNTLLFGDFNTQGVETVGPLTGENDDENDPGGWWIFSNDPTIDRIYVSGDVDASNRDRVEGGSSDHDMLVWDIDLTA